MATLTIKNLPDELYADLTRTAKANRRSINNEAIVTVERGLERRGIDRELLDRIRKRRVEMAKRGVRLTDEILAQSRAELLKRPRSIIQELNAKTKTVNQGRQGKTK